MTDQTKQFTFSTIAHGASRSFRALRVLVSHISGLADEYDRGAVSAFSSALTDLFPTLRSAMASGDTAVESDAGSSESGTEEPLVAAKPLDEEAIKREMADVLSNDDKRTKFFNAVRDFSKKVPSQGRLIRQGALTTLFSHLEDALAQLLHAYYERYPAALAGEDRTLTLADLRQLGSIPEAEKLIVEKEVDAVLRESTETQIEYFRKRLKVDVGPLKSLLAPLVEVAQRRNIYVHNQGKVNRQYLASVDPSLVLQFKAEDSKQLPLSRAYLLSAIDTVDAVAAMLINTCWRKWDEPKDADDHLVEQTYEGLRDQRYDYVKWLAAFASNIDVVKDASRRIVVVNHAIALRETGDQEGVTKVLGVVDWSATSSMYMLALHVLREEREEFLRLLPKSVAAEDISVENLREWPLFNSWRGQRWFDKAVAEVQPKRSIDSAENH